MALSDHSLIVVMPVFEDRSACKRLLEELRGTQHVAAFALLVDDGSVRQPLTVDLLSEVGFEGLILSLRRNVGHQRAIAVALSYVAEHASPDQQVVVMDSDGEDMPSSITEMLVALEPENVDVVVAKRKSRVETWRFKLFYACYKIIFQVLTGKTLNFGNFIAIKAHALLRLVAMQELTVHVAAAVLGSRLRIEYLPTDRGPRYAGHSKMNFVGLILHGIRALMVFAEDMTVRICLASVAIALLSIFGALVAISLKLIGYATPGWFSVAAGILMLVLIQTAVVALLTLTLTGILKGGGANPPGFHRDYIAKARTREDDSPT